MASPRGGSSWGFTMPLKNRTARNAWQRRNRAKKKQDGGCVDCGEKTGGPTRCERCSERANALGKTAKRKLYPVFKALKICVRCRTRTAVIRCVHCGACQEELIAGTEARRARWRANGNCTTCGGIRQEGYLRCAKCRATARRSASAHAPS